jgi:hypothetical protein
MAFFMVTTTKTSNPTVYGSLPLSEDSYASIFKVEE